MVCAPLINALLAGWKVFPKNFTRYFTSDISIRDRQTGGFQTRGFPDLDLSFLFVLFRPFGTLPIFLGFSGFARGWSVDFPDLSFSSCRPIKSTYEEQSRKGPRQSGPFPKKVGNPPVWKPPGLASLNFDSVKRHLRGRHLSVLNLKFDFISDGGCTRKEQIALSLKRHLFPHGGREPKAFWICFSTLPPIANIFPIFRAQH